MQPKAGAQISARAFVQSFLILLLLMLAAGALTQAVPAGRFQRAEQDGRAVVVPGSYQIVDRPDYPAWRWFTAPVEVLWGEDGMTVIVIIVFILMVGSAFAVLDRSGTLKAAIGRLVAAFGGRKYHLLLVVSFFFMLMGAFFGIFEEVVPLIPLMIALAYYLGWDSLTGLGMSILATNLGFSAAITNPFTIGVAQKIAGLPLFSGAGLRVLIFLVIYAIFAVFILRYARRIERRPQASAVFAEDLAQRSKFSALDLHALAAANPRLGRSMAWFLACLVLIGLVLASGPFLPAVSQFALPLVGLLFLVGGVGAGLAAGSGGRSVLRALGEGAAGITPGIPLILMAASVKHIAMQGGVMDTVLHNASLSFPQAGPYPASLLIYGLALFIEFFIGSGSAKAFLMMPILLPLADLAGVTRQIAVTAYCFGDGFSNLVYPTNPVLLISLSLTVVSFPKWLKWSLQLWFWVLLATAAFLGLAVAIGYGPF